MIVYRIAKTNYIDDISGTGARLYGGRWNSRGNFMLYSATNRALAVLELLVHLNAAEIESMNFSIAEIEIPDDSLKSISLTSLSDNWRSPQASGYLQAKGDMWLRKAETIGLYVPSVIIPQEQNILINPSHPDFKKVKLKKTYPFSFDRRLKNG